MGKEAFRGDLAPPPKKRRRRYSAAFKAQVLVECEHPEASVAGVAVRHGLNPNMVQKWRLTQRRSAQQDDFIRLPAPASLGGEVVATSTTPGEPATVRMELPTPSGTLIVHWPIDALARSVDWLRAVTR